MQKGNISVESENIFPVIKKFLYSDNEIFLRELVSNAVNCKPWQQPEKPKENWATLPLKLN